MVKCPNCPHPLKGLHHRQTGKCKLCACEGPEGAVKGGYASTLAQQVKVENRPRSARRRVQALAAGVAASAQNPGSDIGSELSREFKRLTKRGGKS